MSYLHGSYLSGETLTANEANEMAQSEALSSRQRANFEKYLPQVERLSFAARAELARNINKVLASLRPEAQTLILKMASRTALNTGLGGAEGAIGTIASIASLVATLATVGLTVATVVQQRKDQKRAAAQQSDAAAAEQQMLQLQIEEQKTRIAALKGPQPQINPDGSLAIPNAPAKTNTASPAAIGTGLALAATAALVLGK